VDADAHGVALAPPPRRRNPVPKIVAGMTVSQRHHPISTLVARERGWRRIVRCPFGGIESKFSLLERPAEVGVHDKSGRLPIESPSPEFAREFRSPDDDHSVSGFGASGGSPGFAARERRGLEPRPEIESGPFLVALFAA